MDPLNAQSIESRRAWQPLAALFASRNVRAFVMGGALRDELIGRPTSDLDLVVEGDAVSVGRWLASEMDGSLVILDEARNICRVHARIGGEARQLDLARADGGITDYLLNRDFTIDAMAVPLSEADSRGAARGLIDPTGGAADLRMGVIRAVSRSSFRSDPARLMRAARLAVQLGFSIEPETEEMVRREASLVGVVASERVRDELLLLLAEPGAADSLRLLDRLGLLCEVLPELEASRRVTQPKEHYWDVFDHLIETAGHVETILDPRGDEDGFIYEAIPRHEALAGFFDRKLSDGHSVRTLMKLGGLLHDVAKPATRTVEPSGRIRFLGHHTVGSEMVRGILERLRVSRRGVDLLSAAVRNHLRPAQMAAKGEMPSGRAVYRFFRDLGDAAVPTLYLNLADYVAARGPDLREDEWADYCGLVGFILREGLTEKAPRALPKLVDGRDIMKSFALVPGPEVGALLDVAREAQACGEIATKADALDLLRSHLNSGGWSA